MRPDQSSGGRSDGAGLRSSFTLAPVHSRRDASSRITSVAVDPNTQRLFLGLSTGWVPRVCCCAALQACATKPPNAVHNPWPVQSRMRSYVEEHQLVAQQAAAGPAGSAAPMARLVAGRRVSSKHGVAEVQVLPVASRIVVRTDDGAVAVGACACGRVLLRLVLNVQ